MKLDTRFLAVHLSLATLTSLYGQTPAGPVSPSRGSVVQPEASGFDTQAAQQAAQVMRVPSNYVLGPGDQVELRITPEIDDLGARNFRIDTEGNLTLPLVGIVQARGLTAEQLESALAKKFSAYLRSPQVSATITNFRTDPILMTGMFNRPGIYPLQPSSRKLLEVLSASGGLQANASRRIRLARRLENGTIPLPGAAVDETGKVSTVEISLTRLMESSNPPENIDLEPYDVLYAGKAGMVFLNIEGGKAAAFPLDDRDYLSVVQLIAAAGGITSGLAPERARVLRPILDTTRRAEIPLDVKAILEGRKNDYALMPNDLLVIPKSGSARSYLARPLTVAVPALVTGLIWATIRR